MASFTVDFGCKVPRVDAHDRARALVRVRAHRDVTTKEGIVAVAS